MGGALFLDLQDPGRGQQARSPRGQGEHPKQIFHKKAPYQDGVEQEGKMSDEIIKILNDLGERLGIAIDWSSQNVMPYLQDLMDRYINLEIVSSVIWIVISVLAIAGTLVFSLKFVPYAKKRSDEERWSDWNIAMKACMVISIIVVLIFLFMVLWQIFDIVTCCIMPEKIILDYLTSVSI